MQYPKKIMSMKDLIKENNFPRSYLLRAYNSPGQTFAFRKNPMNRTSPIMFDTEEFEKWRMKEIQAENKARSMKMGVM